MLILGIETSCDETSCAVVKAEPRSGTAKILSNIVSSSLFRHKKFGGVVPEIASRHCMEQIQCVFEEALTETKIRAADLGLIAVTRGPGLIGSLFVGVSFAKALAYELGIPLVGVNHMEAHLVANFFDKPAPDKFIGLLVSGGHTMLTYCKGARIHILGETIDDAVGEAYDKVAKILGLGYPGGPIIDKLAGKGDPGAVRFTCPKLDGRFGRGSGAGNDARRFDFSFSGIKTAVLYLVKDPKTGLPKPDAPSKQDIAASFQHAVIDWLVEKTLDAADFKSVSDIVVGGGVSANSHLRNKLTREAKAKGCEVWFPPFSLSTDNGAMIARRGFELYRNGKRSTFKMTGDPALQIH
ncbi:MAG: tRNA N6-adenosine threonylcarbamoyltransferase [Candidatus Omnitrophica bacterium ADurb.Bin277]|nr:MAG: tRNA N6-adenosine threonylcarbamoyltransferase [Candidatus Omnitrophica bacterium ADurb.Bin277]